MNVVESLVNVYSHWHPLAQFLFPLILAGMAFGWVTVLLRGYPKVGEKTPND